MERRRRRSLSRRHNPLPRQHSDPISCTLPNAYTCIQSKLPLMYYRSSRRAAMKPNLCMCSILILLGPLVDLLQETRENLLLQSPTLINTLDQIRQFLISLALILLESTRNVNWLLSEYFLDFRFGFRGFSSVVVV